MDLGLIYEVQGEANNDVNIKMTLTSPGCPMHSMIAEDVKSKVTNIEEIGSVNVAVVWDPPWNPNMMSEEARKKLGYM